jgi:hypothetical protein
LWSSFFSWIMIVYVNSVTHHVFLPQVSIVQHSSHVWHFIITNLKPSHGYKQYNHGYPTFHTQVLLFFSNLSMSLFDLKLNLLFFTMLELSYFCIEIFFEIIVRTCFHKCLRIFHWDTI